MSESKTYYKLGPKASNFFDPTQSLEENKSLAADQVKELEETGRVTRFTLAKGLVIATATEYKDYKKKEKEGLAKSKKGSSKSDNKAIEALKSEKDETVAENEALKAKIAELEAKSK